MFKIYAINFNEKLNNLNLLPDSVRGSAYFIKIKFAMDSNILGNITCVKLNFDVSKQQREKIIFFFFFEFCNEFIIFIWENCGDLFIYGRSLKINMNENRVYELYINCSESEAFYIFYQSYYLIHKIGYEKHVI